MKACLVTAYVPIPGHPRGPGEYGELGEKLSGVPVMKKAFYQKVEDLWLAKYLASVKYPITVMSGDNREKNSAPYHCVNHQKTSWLVQAADENPDVDVLVWVDYGIFRLPGVNNEIIYNFMNAIDDKHIYAPGCWDKPTVVESAYPNWRFCGSLLAVPRQHVDPLDFECRRVARQHAINTKTLDWEVNTWARVEQSKRKLPWHWYKADHDATLFTGAPFYPKPETSE